MAIDSDTRSFSISNSFSRLFLVSNLGVNLLFSVSTSFFPLPLSLTVSAPRQVSPPHSHWLYLCISTHSFFSPLSFTSPSVPNACALFLFSGRRTCYLITPLFVIRSWTFLFPSFFGCPSTFPNVHTLFGRGVLGCVFLEERFRFDATQRGALRLFHRFQGCRPAPNQGQLRHRPVSMI